MGSPGDLSTTGGECIYFFGVKRWLKYRLPVGSRAASVRPGPTAEASWKTDPERAQSYLTIGGEGNKVYK